MHSGNKPKIAVSLENLSRTLGRVFYLWNLFNLHACLFIFAGNLRENDQIQIHTYRFFQDRLQLHKSETNWFNQTLN